MRDKGYDYPRCRQGLRRLHIRIRIGRKGIDSSECSVSHRWVVWMRTIAWPNDPFPGLTYGEGVPAVGVAQLLGSRTASTTSSMAAIDHLGLVEGDEVVALLGDDNPRPQVPRLIRLCLVPRGVA